MKAVGGRSEGRVEGDKPMGGRGRRQCDFTGSETSDEEDVEPPLFDVVLWDPRVLLPQLRDERPP